MDILKRVAGPTAIGLILGIVGLVLSVYTDYFRKPISLSIIIDNEIDVVSVNEKVQNLDIIFRGRNISLENLRLKFIRIKIENNGSTDILQSYFDVSQPWGISLENGEIVEARVLSSTSDYVKDNLNIKVTSLNSVEWEKVILESAESFTIEILVASPINVRLMPRMLGKIAGISNIDTVNRQTKEEGAHWLREVFYGNAIIQFARLLIFFFLTVIIIMLFLLASIFYDSVAEYLEKRKRKKIVVRANTYFMDIQLDKEYQRLSKIFVDQGRFGLISLDRLMKDNNFRMLIYRYHLGKRSIEISKLKVLASLGDDVEAESQDSNNLSALRNVAENSDLQRLNQPVSGNQREGVRFEYSHAIDVQRKMRGASVEITNFFIDMFVKKLIIASVDGFQFHGSLQNLFNHLSTSQT